MPKRLSKYVFREFLPPFGIAILTFTLLLLLHQLFYLLDLFLNRGVSGAIILKLLALTIPIVLPLAIPMAALLAGLLCYSSFSSDGELTALRSSGCPHILYIWPNLVFGLLVSLAILYFNLELAPKSRNSFENLRHQIAQRNPLALFSPKVMNHFGEYSIFVEKMDRRKKRLTGISIHKTNPVGFPTRILAPEGEMEETRVGDFILTLFDGTIHQPDSENEYVITKFDRISLKIPHADAPAARGTTAREMNYRFLKAKIEDSIQQNINPAPWRTEIHLRIAIAAAPALFAGLGILLGIQLKRGSRQAGGSRAIGIGLALIVILFYYGILLYAVPLAAGGHGPPLLLTWMPNFFVMAAISILWMRLQRS